MQKYIFSFNFCFKIADGQATQIQQKEEELEVSSVEEAREVALTRWQSLCQKDNIILNSPRLRIIEEIDMLFFN